MSNYAENLKCAKPDLLPEDYIDAKFNIPAGEMIFLGLKYPKKNSRAVCYNVTLKKLQTMTQFAVNFQIRRFRKEI